MTCFYKQWLVSDKLASSTNSRSTVRGLQFYSVTELAVLYLTNHLSLPWPLLSGFIITFLHT